MGFQKTIDLNPGIAIPGDFASDNDRFSVPHDGEGTFKTGDSTVTIGSFAWANDGLVTKAGGTATSKFGFVGRQAALANYYDLTAEASMTIPAGREVTLFGRGDFYAILPTSGIAVNNQVAFAYDGTVSTVAPDAAAPADSVLAGFKVARVIDAATGFCVISSWI